MTPGFSIVISPKEIDIQSHISKEYDNFHYSGEEVEILIEGLLLNKKKLLQKYALSEFKTLILELYKNKKQYLIKDFEGEIRGFIYDKLVRKIFVFTNITSTQRVFYGVFNKQIHIDTSLVRLNQRLKRLNFSQEPDLDSIYQLLCCGNILENKTPINGVYKILDSRYLEIETDSLVRKEVEYFDLSGTEYFSQSKDKALRKIHEIFTESVLLEYNKDEELGVKHLSLLSGGLDSRVAVLYALQNNIEPDNILCFSQSGYFDETISRKIANDHHLHYEFIPLDKGKFLNKIDKLTEISEGTGLFTGAIHVQYVIENMEYKNFLVFHSGQIGDGILGGFNSVPKRKEPTDYKIVANNNFLPKIRQTLDRSLKNDDREELFLLRNIAYNRTVFGAQVLQQKGYQTSPFMTKDFLQLAISLPEEWKFNHRFYFEWIDKYCKEATKYTWERTLMKPDAYWKIKFGDKFVKRFYKVFYDKVLGMPQKTSMYPYQYYYDSDLEIQQYYQQYFDENLIRLKEYPELHKDISELFSSELFFHKCQAVNVLSIFKLYF